MYYSYVKSIITSNTKQDPRWFDSTSVFQMEDETSDYTNEIRKCLAYIDTPHFKLDGDVDHTPFAQRLLRLLTCALAQESYDSLDEDKVFEGDLEDIQEDVGQKVFASFIISASTGGLQHSAQYTLVQRANAFLGALLFLGAESSIGYFVEFIDHLGVSFSDPTWQRNPKESKPNANR